VVCVGRPSWIPGFSSCRSRWIEGAITAENNPVSSDGGATSGAFPPGSWSNANVTHLVRGNGELSLVVTTKSTQRVIFDSREGAHKPQVVVWAKS
jgi:hypothetical protein